jgi:hypothetical protein
MPFTVNVPLGTPSGDYLAGVVGQPAGPPRRAKPVATRNNQGSVGAAIVTHVAIGVAIIVPGPLTPKVSIPSVKLTSDAGTPFPTVAIEESNLGNTWEHPAGDLTVQDGPRKRSVTVTSNTLLPLDHASLAISFGGISRGDHHVRVRLWYANHTKLAVWQGALKFPTPPKVQASPQGARTIVTTSSHLPTWVIGALAGMGGILLTLLALLLRRRRSTQVVETGGPGA